MRICEHTGKKAAGGRQTLVVSATLTERVLQMCETWCPGARQVFVGGAPVAATAAAEAPAPAAAPAAAAPAAQATPATSEEQRRPGWGWGDMKSPSADAPDFNPGTSSAGGLGSEAAAAASVPPHLRHHWVSSAPQHKVDTLRCGSVGGEGVYRNTCGLRFATADAHAGWQGCRLTGAVPVVGPLLLWMCCPDPNARVGCPRRRRTMHALGAQRALVFMNFQQRLKDTGGRPGAGGRRRPVDPWPWRGLCQHSPLLYAHGLHSKRGLTRSYRGCDSEASRTMPHLSSLPQRASWRRGAWLWPACTES